MADIKVRVNNENTVTSRVGQQNSIKVLSSFNGNVVTTSENVIGGIASVKQLYVSGISTFDGISLFNNSVNILDNFFVSGITTLSFNGGITTTGGDLYVGKDLQVAGNSNFIGTAIFRGGTIGIGDSTSDDINIGGEFVSDLIPKYDNTYDIGSESNRWRNARFSGLTSTNNLNVSGIATIVNIDVNQLKYCLLYTSPSPRDATLNVSGIATIVNIDVNQLKYVGYNTNSVAYFNNLGILSYTNSPDSFIEYTNYILTTDYSGTPAWSNTIDGGTY